MREGEKEGWRIRRRGERGKIRKIGRKGEGFDGKKRREETKERKSESCQ